MTFDEVVRDIYQRYELSLSKFAAGINAVYPDPNDRVVKMTISYWRRGKNSPNMAKIEFLSRYAPPGSWVKEFGQRGSVALCPDWEPTGQGEEVSMGSDN